MHQARQLSRLHESHRAVFCQSLCARDRHHWDSSPTGRDRSRRYRRRRRYNNNLATSRRKASDMEPRISRGTMTFIW